VFPEWLETGLLSTGLFGALMVVNTSQLSPRVIAINYPVYFLNWFIIHIIFRVCMILEFIGFGYCAWLMSSAIAYFTRLKVVQKESKYELEEVLGDSNRSGQLTMSEQLIQEELNFVKYFSLNPVTEGTYEKVDSGGMKLPDYGSEVSSGEITYPSASKLNLLCHKSGVEVPKYLLEPSNPAYVPPHVYACQLLVENQELGQKIRNSSANKEAFSTFQMPKGLNNLSDLDTISEALKTI